MATRKDGTDAQMLFVGSACSLSKCNQHDFLPLRCNFCSETFCSDHFRPTDHECAKYDPAKADRIAPACPLCSTPVSVPVGQDPNLKMDAHIMSECRAMGNKGATRQAPRCAGPKCNKVLISPIRCDSCHKQFCPEHRFPQQHSCATHSTTSVSKPSPMPTSQPAVSKLSDMFHSVSVAGLRPGQSEPSAAAAIAALNRATASTKPTPTPAVATKSKPAALSDSAASSSSNKPGVQNLFSKTDRCDPNLPSSTNANVAPAGNERPAPIDTSYRPPPIFGFA